MDRRSFLQTGAVASIAAAGGGVASAAHHESKAELRFACQEWVLPFDNLEDKVAFMKEHGIEGLEPGGGGLKDRVKTYQNAFKGSELKISAICAGYQGVIISHAPDVRAKAMASMKEILSAAGELGSTGLIIVPAFNGQTEMGHVEGRKLLIENLGKLAEHAHAAGTRILLEPLNRGEAWFLRQLADAASICKDVDHPGICMMGDFYHMGVEEPCDYAAFISCRDYVHHVHLASRPNRKQPGWEEDDFKPGFRALKEIGYTDFCSFECGIEGKKETEIPKSMDYLREAWKNA